MVITLALKEQQSNETKVIAQKKKKTKTDGTVLGTLILTQRIK